VSPLSRVYASRSGSTSTPTIVSSYATSVGGSGPVSAIQGSVPVRGLDRVGHCAT